MPPGRAGTVSSGDSRELVDTNLRSTQAMLGYQIQASDGTIGHVSDFIVDDESWVIRRLVTETGHWLSGKEVLISINQIDGISYEKSKVLVKLTKEAIMQEPEYHTPPSRHHRSRYFATGLVRATSEEAMNK